MRNPHKHHLANTFSVREKRALCFAEKLNPYQEAVRRREEYLSTQFQDGNEKARKVTSSVAEHNASDPLINDERQAHLNELREVYFFDESAESPEIQTAKRIGDYLVKKYQDHLKDKGEKLPGLRFGLNEKYEKGNSSEPYFVVLGADEFFIDFALKEMTTYGQYLKKPRKAETNVFRRKGETAEDFNRRAAQQKKHDERAAVLATKHNKQFIEPVKLIRDALLKGKKNVVRMRDFASGKKPLDKMSDEEKRDNAPIYVKMIVDQSKENPDILAGREEEFGAKQYAERVILPANENNNNALKYFPESLKSSTEKIALSSDEAMPANALYQTLMIEGVYTNADLLHQATEEHEAHWEGDTMKVYKIDGVLRTLTQDEIQKIDNGELALVKPGETPPGGAQALEYTDDQPRATYEVLLENAITTNPEVFFMQAGKPYWREVGNYRQPSVYTNLIKGLSSRTKLGIIEAMRGTQDWTELDDYDGGALQLMRDLATDAQGRKVEPWDLMQAIVNNKAFGSNLIEYIKKNDNELYVTLRDLAAQTDDVDMRRLLAVETLMEDEDLAVKALENFYKALKKAGNDEEKAALLRKNRDLIAKIPAHVLHGEGLFTIEVDNKPQVIGGREFMMMLVGQQGEIFGLLPLDTFPPHWKNDKQVAMWAVNASATTYQHLSLERRNDREVLLGALRSQKAGRGNMHWKHVGEKLKAILANEYDIEGIPNPDELEAIIMGLDYEEALTKENVHSIFDSIDWTQKTPDEQVEAVRSYFFEENNHRNPEYLLDAPDAARHDVTLIKQLLIENPEYFKYIDHAYFHDNKHNEYTDRATGMVPKVVKQRPSYIRHAHENLRTDVKYLIKLANITGQPVEELMAHLTVSNLLTTESIDALMDNFDSDAGKLISFLQTILGDEFKGLDIMEVMQEKGVITSENGKRFLKAYFERYPRNAEMFTVLSDEYKHDPDFVEQFLYVNPKLFQFVDHAHWVHPSRVDTYKTWIKEYVGQDLKQLTYVHEDLLKDVDFLAKTAGANLDVFTQLLDHVPQKLRTDDFVEAVVETLSDTYHVPLEAGVGTARSGQNSFSEGVFDIIEHYVLQKDGIRSVMRFWPDEMSKDVTMVWGFLRDKGKVENIRFVHPDLLNDKEFITDAVDEFGLAAFQYLDHKTLFDTQKNYYMTLVAKVIEKQPELFRYAHENLQNSMSFLWDMSDGEVGNGEGDISAFMRSIKNVSPAERGKKEWLKNIIELIGEKDPSKVLGFLRYEILPDREFTESGVIETILTENNSELLKKLLAADPEFYKSVDSKYLDHHIVFELVARLLPEANGKRHVIDLLNIVEPNVREKFITDYPRLILDLHRDNAQALVDFLGEEHLTFDLMQHALAHYSPEQAIDVLVRSASVKTGVIEGMLHARPDLYMKASAWERAELSRNLSSESVKVIIEHFEDAKEKGIDIARQTAVHRLLDARRKAEVLHSLFSTAELKALKISSVYYKPFGIPISLQWKNLDDFYRDTTNQWAELQNKQAIGADTYHDIHDVAGMYEALATMLQNHLKPDQVVSHQSNQVNTMLLPENPPVEAYGTIASNPVRQQMQLLVTLRDALVGTHLTEFVGDSAEERHEDKVKRIEAMETTIKDLLEAAASHLDSNEKNVKIAAAKEVVRLIEDNPFVLQDVHYVGSTILARKYIDELRQKAQTILDQAQPSPEVRNFGERFPEDMRLFYSLTNSERNFVNTAMGLDAGINKYALAKEVTAMRDQEHMQEVIQAFATQPPVRLKQQVGERYRAIVKAKGQATHPQIVGLYIAFKTAYTQNAPAILEHIDLKEAELMLMTGQADIFQGAMHHINTHLPLDFAYPDTTVEQKHEKVQNLWHEYVLGKQSENRETPLLPPFPSP